MTQFITTDKHPDCLRVVEAKTIEEFILQADAYMRQPQVKGVVWNNDKDLAGDAQLREQFLNASPDRKFEEFKTSPFFSPSGSLSVILGIDSTPQNGIEIRHDELGDPVHSFMETDKQHNSVQSSFALPNTLRNTISELTELFDVVESQIRFEKSNQSGLHYDGTGDVYIYETDLTRPASDYLFGGNSVRMIGTLPITGDEDNTPTTRAFDPSEVIPPYTSDETSLKEQGLEEWKLKPNQWMIFKPQTFGGDQALYHGPEKFSSKDTALSRIFIDHSFGLSSITRQEADQRLAEISETAQPTPA